MNLLTSVQAAAIHGTAASTTRNAAAAGRVAGARQIGGTWVATEAEWREWYETRRPAGRPKKEETTMNRIYSVRTPLGNGPDRYTQGNEVSRHRTAGAAKKAISTADRRLQRNMGGSDSYHDRSACYSDDKGITWQAVKGGWISETEFEQEED